MGHASDVSAMMLSPAMAAAATATRVLAHHSRVSRTCGRPMVVMNGAGHRGFHLYVTMAQSYSCAPCTVPPRVSPDSVQ